MERGKPHGEDSDREGRDSLASCWRPRPPRVAAEPFRCRGTVGPIHRLLDEHTEQDQAGTQRPKPQGCDAAGQTAATLASGPAPLVSPRGPVRPALCGHLPLPVTSTSSGNLCSHCCPRVSGGRRSLLEWGQTKPQSSRETLGAAKRQLLFI